MNQKIARVLIWFSFLVSIFLYAFFILSLKIEMKEMEISKNTILIVGAFFAILPHLLKQIKSLKEGTFIIGLSIGEIPAILGLLLYFLYGDKETSLKLIALSILTVIFLFPLSKIVKNRDEDQIPPPIG